MQTTLLGLAIALILALAAALIGPYFIDWNQFRPQFEAEAAKAIGAPVRVAGQLDARLLPAPSLRLRDVVVGGANDLGKVRADKLDVEFSLGYLMRGEWRANELTVDGMALDLGLDGQGRIDWPASNGNFNFAALSIDRVNLTGRIALHDAASHRTLELNDIAFSGDVRSLAGAIRGDGRFTLEGTRYPFRVSSGQSADGNGTRIHVNIDPGERPVTGELDGVLGFESRAPRFEGTAMLALPAPPKAKTDESSPSPIPWRVSAKIKADHAAAQLEQIEASYGPEERAFRFAGRGDARFGASPLLHAVLAARQLDADRLAGKNTKDNPKDNKDDNGEPLRLLPALRMLMTTLPRPPIPVQIEASSEQLMLGGRPLQNLSASVHGDAALWSIDRLDFRAPGSTNVAFAGVAPSSAASGNFAGELDIESSDPDVLVSWLQGRGDVGSRNQKSLRVRGDLSVSPDRVAVEQLKAEIDGGAVEGRIAYSLPAATGDSRLDAALRAERLDLDAAAAFVRSLAGPPADWPDQTMVSLDVGRATSSGQELRPFAMKLGYTPKTITLEQLKFGQPGGVTMEALGRFDRGDATGSLALSAGAASLNQVTALLAPLAPALAQRIDALAAPAGPSRLKLALDIGKSAEQAGRADARAVLDLNAPQLKATVTIAAAPEISAMRAFDVDRLWRSQVTLDTRLSSEHSGSLLTLLGLDQAVAAGVGPAQLDASFSGSWQAPVRLSAKLTGAGLDADAQGTAQPWTADPKASLDLHVRSINLAPLVGLKPSDSPAQRISLSSRVSLAGKKLSFDDIDSTIATSRLRGRLSLTLDEQKEVDGQVGLDALDLAPAFSIAIGAAGRDASEPLGAGLLKGWHGRIAFQALRGVLPGGAELRPIMGAIKSDGQLLTFDGLKAGVGGGDVNANIDAKQDANGLSLNASLNLRGIDSAALHYRGLTMPPGSASLQMTLGSQGRSLSALTGAMSGSGTLTLQAASLMGLDPRAFEVAIRANDGGLPTDDARLRQMVEPVLSAGALLVPSAQIPFTIRDGRIRVAATALDGEGSRAMISGGYDIPADQVDFRASLASNAIGSAGSRPEIQLFASGSPDALKRTIDVSALSSWLAVRTIDRETRRLDSIERGEPVPPEPVRPSTAALPLSTMPDVAPSDQPLYEVPLPGPHHPQAKARPGPPRLPSLPASPGPSPALTQQAAPLPPPIEVRPAPGAAPAAVKPKPRPPMVLTPPPAPQNP